MGACVSHNRRATRRRRPHSSRSGGNGVGRNKPLSRSGCRPKWKSDVPISENQLRRKREEYWDTAPAFEGRKEIWDALKGACYALEQNDNDLAQSILNCAGISLPYGSLLDCYDELGNRYQLPVYVLSPPTNLLVAAATTTNAAITAVAGALSDGDQQSTEGADNESDIGLAISMSADLQTSSSSPNLSSTTVTTTHPKHQHRNPVVREIKKHHRRKKVDSSGGESSSTTNTPPPLPQQQQSSSETDVDIPIKFRLSNGNEHRMYCKRSEKVRSIKRRLAALEQGVIDSQSQRFFFGGKLLRDRTAISDTRLRRNFVVQVILYDLPVPPNGAVTTTSLMPALQDIAHSTPVESF